MSISKVSARLSETIAPEVVAAIAGPRVAEFPIVFAFLGDINKAHVIMLAECELLSRDRAAALAAGILAMEEAGADAVALDPAREDPYFNYEAHLIEQVGDDVGGRMHIGRSRNDIGATLDRLRTRAILPEIIAALLSVRDTALAQAERYVDVIMPGYTHLQPAQPMTYGFYLAGVAQALERDSRRLLDTLSHANQSPLGAAAFGGTPFAINRARTAELLGFDGFVQNTLDSVASRDFVLEAMAHLSLLSVLWSRVAQDYYVWTSYEFGLIDFPDSISATSSIMPQKKNPIVMEHLKGRSGHVVSTLMAALMGTKSTPFSHNGESSRAAISGFWDTSRDVLRSLGLFELMLRTAVPQVETALRHSAENFSTATALADLMVHDYDLSFRAAHHVVGAVVRMALDGGQSADTIDAEMVEKVAVEQLGRPLGIDPAAIRACLDPAQNVAARNSAGAPSPRNVGRDIASARHRLSEDKAKLARWRDRMGKAKQALDTTFLQLASSGDVAAVREQARAETRPASSSHA